MYRGYFHNGNFRKFLHQAGGGIFDFQNGNSRWPWPKLDLLWICCVHSKSMQLSLVESTRNAINRRKEVSNFSTVVATIEVNENWETPDIWILVAFKSRVQSTWKLALWLGLQYVSGLNPYTDKKAVLSQRWLRNAPYKRAWKNSLGTKKISRRSRKFWWAY